MNTSAKTGFAAKMCELLVSVPPTPTLYAWTCCSSSAVSNSEIQVDIYLCLSLEECFCGGIEGRIIQVILRDC